MTLICISLQVKLMPFVFLICLRSLWSLMDVLLMQERILLDRDRVASKTWYSEGKNRWEMDPLSVPYAVSRNLVQSARIRHDFGAMYIMIKGDEKEYYVDVKVSLCAWF